MVQAPSNPSPDVIRHLMAEADSRPHDVQANAKIGLFLASRRVLQAHAEPYLLRALAAGPDRPEQVVDLLFALAIVFSAKGDKKQALAYAEAGQRLKPEAVEFRIQKIECLFRLGLYEQSSQEATMLVEAQADLAKRYGQSLGRPPIHVLSPAETLCRYFGEMAAKPDLYLKARKLGLVAEADAYLLAEPAWISNPALLDYWAAFISIQESAACLDKVVPGAVKPTHYLDYCTLPDGRTLHRDQVHRAVQCLWEKSGFGPLLTLKEQHREEGWRRLRSFGLGPDDWFVAWHVRDSRTYNDTDPTSPNRYRNADIASYGPAVREILNQGGWVVRMGDSAMPPLIDPGLKAVGFDHPHLIDYAHGGPDLKADWMDLFLVAEADFYFGMASGPSSVAVNFGTSTLGTNWFHLGPWPYCTGDLFIPKRLVHASDGRPLTLSETLQPGLWGALEPPLIEGLGLAVVDNTPEELFAVTSEMLARQRGTWAETAESRLRQAAFAEKADPLKLGMPALCGDGFLQAHPELMA